MTKMKTGKHSISPYEAYYWSRAGLILILLGTSLFFLDGEPISAILIICGIILLMDHRLLLRLRHHRKQGKPHRRKPKPE